MNLAENNRFDLSSIDAGYAEKRSMARYRILINTFPNTLVFFEHNGYCYGFDETAAAISLMCGYKVDKQKEMLVIKFENSRFDKMIVRGQMRGYRIIIDKKGKLAFIPGYKYNLEYPIDYYKDNYDIILNKKNISTVKNSYSKNGRGWHEDVWAPGLPSSRFFRKKK